jgi:hypothetical protein
MVKYEYKPKHTILIMKIAGIYSFNDGVENIKKNYAKELAEINDAIKSIDASLYKTKESKEKTMKGC